MKRSVLVAPLVVGMIGLAAGGAAAQRGGDPGARPVPGPAPAQLLGQIEKGLWELKSRDGGTRRLCVADAAALIQLYHPRQRCDHQPMDSNSRSVTMRYTCAGHGQGRTTIQLDTPRSLSLDTQGVADGMPFSEQFDARRIGACN